MECKTKVFFHNETVNPSRHEKRPRAITAPIIPGEHKIATYVQP